MTPGHNKEDAMPTSNNPLPEHLARRLAAEHGCDPRSLKKILRGGQVRGEAGERARRALELAGLLPVAPILK